MHQTLERKAVMENKSISMAANQPATANWYLVQCKPRDGFRAADHLTMQGYRIFHPTHKVTRRHANRRKVQDESLFPHYLFVRLAPEQSFATINATRGVAKVVGFQGQPSIVSPAIITALMRHCRILNGQEPEPEFKPGQPVTITEGCFKAVEAIVKATRGDERVILLMNLVHQQHELELPVKAVRAV